jgi:hypothetical protein
MRTLPPSLAGQVGRGRPWAKRMVRLATHALPRGPVRDRYRAELIAELDPLNPGAQAKFAAGVVASCFALRRAVSSMPTSTSLETAMTVPRKPLLCRTNMHHRWEWAHTPDGQRYVRCARCLKERGDGRTGMSGAMMGMGGMGA